MLEVHCWLGIQLQLKSKVAKGCDAGLKGIKITTTEFLLSPCMYWAFLVAQMVKNLPATWETRVESLGLEYPLEKRMATHSSILAWRIPWTEEPGRLHKIAKELAMTEGTELLCMQGTSKGLWDKRHGELWNQTCMWKQSLIIRCSALGKSISLPRRC